MPHDHGAVLQFDDETSLALTTLASVTAKFAATIIDAARLQGFYLIWVKYAGVIRGKTTTEGPLIFGLCANLSPSELAAILTDDTQDRSAPTKTGPGSWYYPLSLIGLDVTEGDLSGRIGSTEIQGIVPFSKIPVRWTVPEGDSLNWFVYNVGSGALTTGASIALTYQLFGAWLRD